MATAEASAEEEAFARIKCDFFGCVGAVALSDATSDSLSLSLSLSLSVLTAIFQVILG